MNVRLRRSLWTSGGLKYLAGDVLTVTGEWKGKLDLDGPRGKLYRVPLDAVEAERPTPTVEPRPVALPRRDIPIGSVEVP